MSERRTLLKTIARWGLIVVGVIVLLVTGVVGWIQLTYDVDHPETPLPDVTAASDDGAVERGAYVVHAVAHCGVCHAPNEKFDTFDFDPANALEGGHVWKLGPFGVFTAANITPDEETGIGGLSDAAIARAIRHGVRADGKLAPMMRFGLGPMADEDIADVIAYLRAQPPVAAARAPSKFGLLAKALSGRFQPKHEETPPYVPAGGISVERGRYLAEGPAACAVCHSPRDPMAGFGVVGPMFSGALAAEPDPENPRMEIMAPNLTPHATAGYIAGWSEDAFVARFRAGRVVRSSSMPWEAFAGLTEDDVRSIYRFLQTVPPAERDLGPPYRQRPRR